MSDKPTTKQSGDGGGTGENSEQAYAPGTDGSPTAETMIPEDFQKQCHGLACNASKAMLGHMHSVASYHEDKLRKADMAKKKPSNAPDEYNTVGMPD